MGGNQFGQNFRITTFGESHGPALGVVIDGCPSEIPFDLELLNFNLNRRRPGREALSTARQESDAVEILSGVFEGRTLGTPIAMMVRNHDARSKDYEQLPARRGHADDLWPVKFGFSDPRGGGRASGRETVARVLAGSVAQMFNRQVAPQMKVGGFVAAVGQWTLSSESRQLAREKILHNVYLADEFPLRIPDGALAEEVAQEVARGKEAGESFGGEIELRVQLPPIALGQPVFRKLKADLAAVMMSVGASCAVELGGGDLGLGGKDFHQSLSSGEGPSSDPYGGIRGGLSTGETIELHIWMKPPSSHSQVALQGRHDPCILPRALPVLEAMAHLVLADHLLWRRLDRCDGRNYSLRM